MSELYSSDVTISNVPLPVDGSNFTQPVSGTISVSNFPEVQAVSGELTIAGSSTASITRIATSYAIPSQLFIANPNRKKFIVTSEDGLNYVALGSEASSVNYTFPLIGLGSLIVSGWLGSVSLIRADGDGHVQITELS